MDVPINFLHLTDLHLGMDHQDWLWPRVKHDFFDDLTIATDSLGDGWDLVLFSGDLTQSGTVDEFDRAEDCLGELWQKLCSFGKTPRLCVVPGNHDLVRPSDDSAAAKALKELWATDEGMRIKFWKDPHSEYRVVVAAAFSNYTEWLRTSKLPLLSDKVGSLPGDFSATFEKNGAQLGIIGLNSAIFHMFPGDRRKKLDIHVSQLTSLCEGDPVSWLRRRDGNIMMTHHPASWLSDAALEHWRQEIHLPGEYLSHICGHQHEPEAVDTGEAGAQPRRIRQAASLFGLETWSGETGPEKRIHGYSACQLRFRDQEVVERLFPRRSVKGRHGGLHIGADNTFKLRSDNSVVVTIDRANWNRTIPQAQENAYSTAASERHLDTVQPFDDPLAGDGPTTSLSRCPRFTHRVSPAHRNIRREQQSEFRSKLLTSRHVWLAADWGMGARDFIASAMEQKPTGAEPPHVFIVSCGDVDDFEWFEQSLHSQLGIPLQTFCAAARQLDACILVLDDLHPSLCDSCNMIKLDRIVRAILDYADNLQLVLVARLRPHLETVPTVELRPLDELELRDYLLAHPEASTELWEPDVLEKLHDCTEGVPMHVDRALRALHVASLDTILSEENAYSQVTREYAFTEAPKALVHTVHRLASSSDRQTRRSLRLLKILTILPYGESFETLKHFLPTEPFHEQNALQLRDLSLLEVQVLNSAPSSRLPQVGTATSPKILRVPRQVRDYVQSIIPDGEHIELVHAGLDRYFGASWIEGKPKARTVRTDQHEYLSAGPGNEFALIRQMLSLSEKQIDKTLFRRSCVVAQGFIKQLLKHDRYRDVAATTPSLLGQIDRETNKDVWADIAARCGQGLRMTGRDDEALRYLHDALSSFGAYVSNDEKSRVWIDIAYCEKSLGHAVESVRAANEAKGLAGADSGVRFQADSIILESDRHSLERSKSLVRLEKQARSKGYKIVANNIALNLASETPDRAAEDRYLGRVLDSREFGYNQVRALVKKATAQHARGLTGKLAQQDLHRLGQSYSYLHAQRFNTLFDQCHDALWTEFEARGNTQQLLRLFRHTSFLWRIRGDETKEEVYVRRLEQRTEQPAVDMTGPRLVAELKYFLSRLTALLGGEHHRV